ncbi:GGDEF domain-containing protein [Pseudofrankia asymbiotica]|uniref:GGDEF domain-containing protein n=1 Tax=Pseudofrankia asymbiotica TaxID=1834516 RepID=A0A1V2I1B0_9ACTN|nr:GGDEF domain-containing protein [Pseudofrankia asymbiotica]ONH22032.1 GGDEF domain-containing protein [Pseudofrankia asymbiotica]
MAWVDELFDRLEIGLTLTCIRSRRIRRANAAACHTLGRARADLVGATWDALDLPPLLYSWANLCRHLSSERTMSRHLTRIVRPDGTPADVLITASLEADAGEPCCLSQILDVTDAETARHQLQLVLENSPVSIGLTDLSGRIVVSAGGDIGALVNDLRAAERSSIFEVFTHAPECVSMVRRAADGEPSTGTTEVYGHYYDMRIRPVRDPAGEVSHVAAIATDVTEREQAHAEQSVLTELAHQALQIVEPDRLWNQAATVLASRLSAAVTVHATEPGDEPRLVAAAGALPPAAVLAAATREALLSAPSNHGDGAAGRNPRRVGHWSTASMLLGQPNAPAAVLSVHRTDQEHAVADGDQHDEGGSLGPAAGPFTRREVDFVDAVASVLGSAAVRFTMEREARYRALHDSLTDLPNRAALLDRLGRSLEQNRNEQVRTGVAFVDLDGFKSINDTLGHRAGDDVLREVADRLRASVRPNDVVARLAGDEFAVLCEHVSTITEVEQVAHRVITALTKPIPLPETEATVTASVGVAISGTGLADPDRLLNASDVAMYTAKRAGPGRCVAYQPVMCLDPATSPHRTGRR